MHIRRSRVRIEIEQQTLRLERRPEGQTGPPASPATGPVPPQDLTSLNLPQTNGAAAADAVQHALNPRQST